jgi:hypothetical protein
MLSRLLRERHHYWVKTVELVFHMQNNMENIIQDLVST